MTSVVASTSAPRVAPGARAVAGAPRARRRGIGVVFLLAIGVIVVVSVFMASQMSVQQSTGKEIGAMALGARAQLACESGIAEAGYSIQTGALEGSESDPTFATLRGFRQDEELDKEVDSLLTGKTEYVMALPYSAKLTREAYSSEQDISFGPGLAALVERKGFPGERDLLTFDHEGVLAFEQAVTITPPYGGFGMTVTARHLRAYRAILADVPPPFSHYTAIVDDVPGDANPLRKYWDVYKTAKAAWIADGRDEGELEDFPVALMDEGSGRYFVTAAPALNAPDAWNVEALATSPGTFGASWLEDVNSAIAVLQTAGWHRPERDEEERLRKHRALLTKEALSNRSVFEVESMADLAGYFHGEGDELVLDGIIHVKGPLLLDNPYAGEAVVWTDDPEGIRIRSLTAVEEGSHLVVIATRGDIEIEAEEGAVVQASLLAPESTVRGLEGITLEGRLMMKRFPPEPFVQGPTITRPPWPAFDPEPGRPLTAEERAAIQIFFDPGIVRKDSRRRRTQQGLFGG